MSFSSCPPFWTGGPDPAGYHSFPNRVGHEGSRLATSAVGPATRPITRSQYPITTGTSVFGLKYKDGVVLAADVLGSYGSLARFPNLERVVRINDTSVVACTGDYADFQLIREILEQKQIDSEVRGGAENMKPKALHCWLTRFLYARRSRFDPLWTKVLVGGVQDGEPFLGLVDYIGTAFTEDLVATGLGADIAVPIMRAALEKKDHTKLSLEEAKDIVKSCLRVCFLRDCRASSQYHLAYVTKDGTAKVEDPEVIDSNWEIAKEIKGYE